MLPKRYMEAVPTPEQRMQRRFRELGLLVDEEVKTPTCLIRGDDGQLCIMYTEGENIEVRPIDESPLSDFIAFAKACAKNLDIDPDKFWDMTKNDHRFDQIHITMDGDPIIFLKIRASLEAIFSVPLVERLYDLQYEELRNIFHNEDVDTELPTDKITTPNLPRTTSAKSKHKILAGGVLVMASLLPAACAVFDNDPTVSTLPPLITGTTSSVTSFTPETSTVTTLAPLIVSSPETQQSQPLVPADRLELVPAETTPPTTLAVVETPPPTAPLTTETSPTTTPPVPSDGVLSANKCAEESGSGVRFYSDGPQLWPYLKSRFSLTDGQVNFLLRNTDMLDRYEIRDIWGSEHDGDPEYFECIPFEAVVDHYMLGYTGV